MTFLDASSLHAAIMPMVMRVFWLSVKILTAADDNDAESDDYNQHNNNSITHDTASDNEIDKEHTIMCVDLWLMS